MWSLVVLASLLSFAASQTQIQSTPPFATQVLVPGITRPRTLILDPEGDILVNSATLSRVTAIRETLHGNGTSTVTTTIIIQGTGLGLNHGLAYHGGFLYCSSPSGVFRWPYRPGQFSLIPQNQMQNVITGIPTGGHSTRTLLFDNIGRLHVTIGTLQNTGLAPQQSMIRRFNVGGALPILFANGEIFASGCRNTLGITFDSNNVLWSVDMGADMLNRPDLGGALWGDNPGDEMNHFPQAGRFYGFPNCWTTFDLGGFARGTQFAWPTFMGAPAFTTDAWCRNPNNNFAPLVSFPAHSSPMSIEFFRGVGCGVNGGFPCASIGNAFVTFRGSWHPGAPHGYRVSQYPFNAQGMPTGAVTEVIIAPNAVPSCNSCLRPAGAIFNRQGHLLVTGDTTHEIFRVAHNWQLPVIQNINL